MSKYYYSYRRVCEYCKKTFTTNNKNQRYCSHKCGGIGPRKAKWQRFMATVKP